MTASPHLSDDVHVPPTQSGAFRSRLIVAVGIILAFVGLATADATAFGGAAPAWWLVPAAVVLAQGAAAELIRLVAARGLDIRTWLVQIGTVVIVLSPLLSQTVGQPVDGSAADHAAGVGPLGWTAVACVAVWGGLLLTEVARYRRDNHGLERFVAGMAITCGLGLPLAFLVGLRLLGRDLADAYAANGQRAKLQLQGLDLNGDGQQDAIVLVDHPVYCGSRGCAVHVFVGEGSALRRVGDILASEVTPAPTTTAGWRDLSVNGRRWHMAQGQYRPAPQ